jgi:hypothetical protein
VELVLDESLFENDKYSITYGNNRVALFTIIDEEFKGRNNLGRVNRITILTADSDNRDALTNATLRASVIGFGDQFVSIRSDDPSLRGKPLTHENMDRCIVELYE